MNTKIFSLLIFSIFLLSGVSAMTVYGDFASGSQSAIITQGNSISFNADFFSMSPPITSMKVQLFQGNSLISTFLDSSTNSQTYSNTYTYTASTAGTYTIQITGTDNTNADSETLTLTVNPVIPPTNHAPVITSIPITQVNEGQSYNYHVTATDSDGDTLTYSLTQKPSWLSINSATGLISGTAPSVNSDTNYNVVVSVSDGKTSVTQSYVLTVKNIPVPPIDTTKPIITLLGPNPQTITRGNSYHEYGATAIDNVDGDLTSEIIIDSSDVNTNVVGTYFVAYNVEDSSGNQAITKTRIVKVVSSNNKDTTPPEITIISPEENHEYDSCSLSIKVSTDEDADVTFRLDEGVVTEMNNSSDNKFTYTLNDLSDGKHYLTFYATDDAGNIARENIGFYVKNCEENNNNNEVATNNVRFIPDNFYDDNRYYDQFASNVVNNGVATSGAIYDTNSNTQATQTQNSGNLLLIILLVTLITSFSAVLIGLAIFIARKPRRIQGQRRQKLNPESYY